MREEKNKEVLQNIRDLMQNLLHETRKMNENVEIQSKTQIELAEYFLNQKPVSTTPGFTLNTLSHLDVKKMQTLVTEFCKCRGFTVYYSETHSDDDPYTFIGELGRPNDKCRMVLASASDVTREGMLCKLIKKMKTDWPKQYNLACNAIDFDIEGTF